MEPEASHHDLILDQFTRQAPLFARAERIRSEDILGRMVRMGHPGPEDTVLDVACGPGLVTCAFARVVRAATGIDMTPAMLELAREEQKNQHLTNLQWDEGDVTALPYPDGEFSIVCTRFSLHHIEEPATVLREMFRVCRPGGRIVVADSAPETGKAEAFNAFERLRDPSHTRALPVEELAALFQSAGFGAPEVQSCRSEGALDDLLRRSFPREGDEPRLRKMIEESLSVDHLDLVPRRQNGQIHYAFPIAILAATRP